METKKMNGAELIEAMRAAVNPRHDVPADWPEILRTDKAIKLAYAFEATGYLDENWQLGPKLHDKRTGIVNISRASYVAQKFKNYLKKGQSYTQVFTEYWSVNIVRTRKEQNGPVPEIDAICRLLVTALPMTAEEKDFSRGLYAYSLSMIELQKEITQLICNALWDSRDWCFFRDFVRNAFPDDMKISHAFDRFTGNLLTAAVDEATAIMAEVLEE